MAPPTAAPGTCRVSVLSLSLLLLSLLGPAQQARSAPVPCQGKLTRVIIIGAGISGAAAAQNLTASSSCFQVTVLDGRPRVGGRMYSKSGNVSGLGEVRAEMGGQWIQSYINNPITALAKKYGLRYGAQNGNMGQYSASGVRYTDAQQQAAYDKYDPLVAKADAYAKKADVDISLDEAFRKVNQNLYLTPFVQSQIAEDFEFEYGGMNNLSGYYYDDDSVFAGGDVLVVDGYDNIPKNLMQEAQGNGATLRLNYVVTNITQNAGGGVTVYGMNSSGGPVSSYEADYIILTAPLGVLKAGSIGFQPALSQKKQGAIDRMGWGYGTKVVLFYKTPFWDLEDDEFTVEDTDLPANRGKFPDWRNLVHPEGQTALMGYALGEYAKRMKGQYTQLVTDARAKVTAMFPQARDPVNKPLCYWVKDWGWDPMALGIYSYAKVGMKENDYDTMALPEGRILFAGEHTNGKYRSTVPGAYLSGLREAQRLLKITA